MRSCQPSCRPIAIQPPNEVREKEADEGAADQEEGEEQPVIHQNGSRSHLKTIGAIAIPTTTPPTNPPANASIAAPEIMRAPVALNGECRSLMMRAADHLSSPSRALPEQSHPHHQIMPWQIYDFCHASTQASRQAQASLEDQHQAQGRERQTC